MTKLVSVSNLPKDSSEFRQLLSECESLVRSGGVDIVRKRLLRIPTGQVPREWRLPLANMARRTGLVVLGHRLLSPVISNGKGKWGAGATPAELAEYAVLLFRNGSVQEATWALNQVDARAIPDTNLYRAFCSFAIWDYETARKCLEDFLASDLQGEAGKYQRLVGSVNLSAALVALGRADEAEAQLAKTTETTRELGYSRLNANCFELRAQLHFQKRQFDRARADLAEAARLAAENSSLDQFFVRKWMAVIQSFETGSCAPIDDFRTEALAAQHWESVREADRFSLQIKFDQTRLEHLLFGTPFARYRESLIKDLGHGRSSDSHSIGNEAGPTLDIQSGKIDGAKGPPRKVHQLIDALTRDFYRPLPVGALFAELSPNEHFDVFSSVHRVQMAIYRTRQWLTESKIPMAIDEVNGKYSLRLTGDFAVRVPYDRRTIATDSIRIDSLRGEFSDAEFSASEACATLAISPTVFKGLMQLALKNGDLIRLGAGRATRYRFPASGGAAAA